MTTRPPAEIGMSLDEVDTPALVIDLDAFERNLKRLSERIAGSGVRLRPHAKTHKCAVIALKQIELGAVGVCCQKVSEAEALVYGGVKDVLVTNEIVGKQKLRRLMGLAGSAKIATCADDPAQVTALNEAAGEAGITLPVHVEVNMGGNRCGVEPAQPALDLARKIMDAPHLSFAGLQAYHGSAQHLRTWEERQKAIAGAVEKAGSDARPPRPTASPAPTSPAPAPARSSSKPRAASIPSCNAARTSSWTPITAGTSTATAATPAPSSRAFSSGRR
jgi:3-hydroxy-D-aspartate aldolase